MIRRTFNLFASISAFAIGAIYLFSDGASVTANVVGASGSIAGMASIIGIVMIIGSIGLFMITLHHVDDHEMDLEKLVKRTNTPTTLPVSASQEIAKESTITAPTVSATTTAPVASITPKKTMQSSSKTHKQAKTKHSKK